MHYLFTLTAEAAACFYVASLAEDFVRHYATQYGYISEDRNIHELGPERIDDLCMFQDKAYDEAAAMATCPRGASKFRDEFVTEVSAKLRRFLEEEPSRQVVERQNSERLSETTSWSHGWLNNTSLVC